MNSIIFNNSLARKIRQDRKRTLLDIEKLTGYSRSLISEWELGKKKPKLDQVILLANIYDISIEELCNVNTAKKLITPNNQANDLAYISRKRNISIFSNIDKLYDNLKLILDYLSQLDAIFYIKNIHNQYIFYSQSFLNIADIKVTSPSNIRSDYDLFSNDEAERNSKEDKLLFQKNATTPYLYVRKIFNQPKKLGEYSKKILFDEKQNPIGLICLIKDITKEQEEKEFQSVLFSAMAKKHGAVIERVYPTQKYYVNSQTAKDNFGNYEIRKDNFWEWMKYVHPDYLYLKIKLGRHIPVPFPYRYMTLLPGKKIKWIEQVLYLIRLSNGAIIRTGYQVDITDIMKYKEQRIITRLMEKTLSKYLLNFRMTSVNRDVQSFHAPFLKETLKAMKYTS